MKKFLALLVLVLAVAIAVVLGARFSDLFPNWAVRKTESQGAVVLRVQELEFLVTQNIKAQFTDQMSEYSVWTGEREGLLIGIINIYYGIDLKKVTDEAVRQDGTKTIVELPEPEILDISVEPGSTKYFSRRSGLLALTDILSNRNDEALLRERFTTKAREFYSQKGYLPSKEDVLNNLRKAARTFSPKDQNQIEFRYKAKP